MNAMPQLPVHIQDQDIAFTYWMKEASDDKFVVTAFAVDEAIFGMTRIEVMLSSKDDDIDLQALIDSPGTLTIHHKYLETLRHFSGIVVEAERGNRGHHRTAYRLVLMPSLYRLDHGSDCRIFQQKKVPEIVRQIFSEHGIENVLWEVEDGKHEIREYCVQYRESHLAFIERILAEEGIFYYFEHDKNGQLKLIISDRPNVLPDCPGQPTLEYNGLASGAVKGVYCSSLSYREKLRATTFTQRDYTFRNPEYNQEHKKHTSSPNGEKKDYELYDYPGRYKRDAAGRPFTRYKLEATRVDASLGYGVSNAPLLLTGHGITLEEHPDNKINQKWRLLTIRHEGVQPQAWEEDGQGVPLADTGLVAPGLAATTLSGLSFGITSSASPNLLTQALSRRMNLALKTSGEDNASLATLYANAFTVQPSRLPYRPPQVLKPLVDGPQIANVVGPPKEEIYTDKYGRVKVHFPWDRHKDPNAEDSSCWIRVSMNWAGNKWGHVALPRIGHEVIVDFLEGDPDQPIIIGRTYNEKNMPPYELPADKTKMVIRSHTHKGDGFNELSFEDEKGREKIYLHGQKNQETHIQNNSAKRVDNNRSESVGHNSATYVGNNLNKFVGGDMNVCVGPSPLAVAAKVPIHAFSGVISAEADALGIPMPTTMGMGNLNVAVMGNKTETVAGISAETVGPAKLLSIGGVYQESIGGIKEESIGGGFLQEVGGIKMTLVGGAYMIIVGKAKIIMKSDGTIMLDGAKIVVGGTDSVTVSGGKVDINP